MAPSPRYIHTARFHQGRFILCRIVLSRLMPRADATGPGNERARALAAHVVTVTSNNGLALFSPLFSHLMFLHYAKPRSAAQYIIREEEGRRQHNMNLEAQHYYLRFLLEQQVFLFQQVWELLLSETECSLEQFVIVHSLQEKMRWEELQDWEQPL